MILGFLCPGAPEGSIGSGSDFKASQERGYDLKSHPTDWDKPGINGLQDIGLCPTHGGDFQNTNSII